MAVKQTLGLDLGPNSVGWALIQSDGQTTTLVDIGVRVFPEGVDNFDSGKEVSRNESRRVARGMRRQTSRRSRRRRHLTHALQECGLWPAANEEQQVLMLLDPYALRTRALDEPLEPFQLGRVLLNLNQRRGFLSNSKRDKTDTEVQGMLAEIGDLEQQIQAAGCRTLGEFLHQKHASLDHKSRTENDRIRNRHTARRMLLAEFDQIWNAQQRHLPGHLTDALKYGDFGHNGSPRKPIPRNRSKTLLKQFGLHGLIFFQRAMYWPQESNGRCELEPSQPRCPKMDRRAQLFRLWQEINNLRFIDDSDGQSRKHERPLDDKQRALLFAKLRTCEVMTFDQIRRSLGFLEDIRFNLERGKRSKLQGMVTDSMVAKAVGKDWHQRAEADKTAIVAALLGLDRDEDKLLDHLVSSYQLSPEEAEKLLAVDLPRGYINFGINAISKLLPFLERGLVVMAQDESNSALHAAGYRRRDERVREPLTYLPSLDRTPGYGRRDLGNPVVRRTLVEMRRVVNAVVREYGRPDAIHMEMGRDVKTRPKPGTEAYRKYKEHLDDMREREQSREQAVTKLRESHQVVNRNNILKVLLWEEQNHTCIYSGLPIGWTQLFSQSGEIEIDHILPRSRSLDDSQMNKVVCFRQTQSSLGNLDKGQRTPHQWLAALRPNEYNAMLQRARQLPYRKRLRFQQKEVQLDDFIARQLNDMRYASRAGADYLRLLYEQDHHVIGLRGQLTSELRHQWGLDTILAELPDSPAWEEDAKVLPGEKNRADHRHHAVDALLIALTDRRRLQQLAKMIEAGGFHQTGEIQSHPWDTFRDDVGDRLARVNVSHRPQRKLSGRLHEESVYGATPSPESWVIRKPVESLSPSEVERIRDEGIRRIVVKRLQSHNIGIGRGQKKPSPKIMSEALADLAMPSGVPIKKVRVLRPELTIGAIREATPGKAYVKPGNTHHICLFEWEVAGKRRRDAIFVTLLEAARRLHQGEDVIQRIHPTQPQARFLMSISQGEMFDVDWKGVRKLLVFRTAASTQGQLYFADQYDARKSSDIRKYVANANTLTATKVVVDPLGRIRSAND